MITVSVLNYLMSGDNVSLGIFIFLGIGFIFNGIKNRFSERVSKRINNYSLTFFFGAAAIFLYWLAVVKLQLF